MWQLYSWCLLTLMLQVANLADTKSCKKPEKWPKLLQMGTHLRVLSESYPMSTNMTGFEYFFEFLKKNCVLVLWMKVASGLIVAHSISANCVVLFLVYCVYLSIL